MVGSHLGTWLSRDTEDALEDIGRIVEDEFDLWLDPSLNVSSDWLMF